MPGIDFREARARVHLLEVLKLIGFEPRSRWQDQVRGSANSWVRNDSPLPSLLCERSVRNHEFIDPIKHPGKEDRLPQSLTMPFRTLRPGEPNKSFRTG